MSAMKMAVCVVLLVLALSSYAECFVFCKNCTGTEDSGCATGAEMETQFCLGMDKQCYAVGFADTKEVARGCWITPKGANGTDYCTFHGLKDPDICRVCELNHCNRCPIVF